MLNDDYCISIEHLKASKSDIEALKPIQTLLAKTGFTLTLTEKSLIIKLDLEKYNRQLRLNAGRKIRLSNYKYSELIYMMYVENLSDYEIMDRIGMKKATYYRHKAKMLESPFYKSMNVDLELTKEYLEQLPDNEYF